MITRPFGAGTRWYIVNDSREYGVRAGARFYGAPVGILGFDFDQPLIPGSMGNASSFSVPVQFGIIEGCTPADIMGDVSSDVIRASVAAAKKLENDGARFISGACGYFLKLQSAISQSVRVPVALSSLLLIPWLECLTPRCGRVGVIAAVEGQVDRNMLSLAGSADPDRIALEYISQHSPLHRYTFGETDVFDAAAMRDCVVNAAAALLQQAPDVSIILLECSEFPPYANAVHSATGVPVFDFVSLVEFFISGLRPRIFEGWY